MPFWLDLRIEINHKNHLANIARTHLPFCHRIYVSMNFTDNPRALVEKFKNKH